MSKSIILLRGINVGGHRKLPMADLRAMCTDWGLRDVVTYIQSGNIVATAPAPCGDALAKRVRTGLAEALGWDLQVEVRSAAQWQTMVADFPFGTVDPAQDGARYHVMFLDAEPAAAAVADLLALVKRPDRLAVQGREVYLDVPAGYGRSSLTNVHLEKRLGVGATARNWKTVMKLQELAQG